MSASAAFELSVSDVVLAAAFGTAVLLGTRPYSRALRQLLWLNLVYQFTTLFTVIVNPYVANTVEWFHAWLLVSGLWSSAGLWVAAATRGWLSC